MWSKYQYPNFENDYNRIFYTSSFALSRLESVPLNRLKRRNIIFKSHQGIWFFISKRGKKRKVLNLTHKKLRLLNLTHKKLSKRTLKNAFQQYPQTTLTNNVLLIELTLNQPSTFSKFNNITKSKRILHKKVKYFSGKKILKAQEKF